MMKYGNWTLGQVEALINILGGQKEALAILRGEKEVVLKDVLAKLFDKHGRRIPPRIIESAVCDPDGDFYLVQPKIDYGDRLARFGEYFHEPCMSMADFQSRARQLLKQIKKNKRLANLLKGVYLPIVLPTIKVKGDFDYGRVLEQQFLPAVASAYQKQFPEREFCNYRKGKLVGEVSIIEGSRHDQLIAKMEQGQVVAVYFPDPLRGFSVYADREQMDTLPEGLLLAGGFDAATAMVMYPDVLARDGNTPTLQLSALSLSSAGCRFGSGSCDVRFCFDGTAFLTFASDVNSGGFLFLG